MNPQLAPLQPAGEPAENGEALHAGCVGASGPGAGCAHGSDDGSRSGQQAGAESAGAGCAADTGPTAANRSAKPPATLREFERALRGLGFTRLQAEIVARKGYAGLADDQPAADPAPDQSEHLREALEALAQSLKGFP